MKINKVIGAYLKAIRQENGFTLDRVATEARSLGATWTSSKINALEKGISTGSLANMLILAKTLSSLTGEDIRLSDLALGDGVVELDGDASISCFDLRRALAGKPFELEPVQTKVSEDPEVQKITRMVASSVGDLMQKVSDKLFFEAARLDGAAVLNTAPTLAEQRAAKQLGLTPRGTAALCQLAYNQSLDEEAAQRAGEHATPQKRGRETRVIRAELESLLDYILEAKDLPASWQDDYDDDSLRRADSMSIVNGTYTQPIETDGFESASDAAYLDLAAKHGDIEREQEAYEELP
ncbi:MAG: hypothetical protein ACLSDW_10165 [Bifidobacterium longum]|jgi:hypothetical protein|uniref:hypothetical protein n=1 Tax=Bifidobacterium longum TaxID=216816 RepID=UPI00206CF87E|nr:MAG TPA: Transcriptional regulator [Caudoviricetes sp.]